MTRKTDNISAPPLFQGPATVVGFGTSDDKITRKAGLVREGSIEVLSPSKCVVNRPGSYFCGHKSGVEQCPVS